MGLTGVESNVNINFGFNLNEWVLDFHSGQKISDRGKIQEYSKQSSSGDQITVKLNLNLRTLDFLRNITSEESMRTT